MVTLDIVFLDIHGFFRGTDLHGCTVRRMILGIDYPEFNSSVACIEGHKRALLTTFVVPLIFLARKRDESII